jgi:serine/threonine protein kinase
MDTPKTIGRYELLEELGHGAMGTVYRAKDPAMDRVVALKTIISVALASQQGSEFRERFYREARAAGGLAHPGIVPVFDVGEHEGVPFLVMEFINGQTLADAVKKNGRMTLERVCEIGQQIAEALGYAHQHGVIHRDIKPANILLTSRETYGIERPKVTDFGVAKLAAGQITLTGQMLGTPAFMPPEQFTGAPINGRADLFSLGVILYWMATGEQPFPGDTMTAVSYKVVHMEPVPPRKLNPSIPAKLESVILKCLTKSPEERYQTGEELARDLAGLRTGGTATGLQSAAPQAAMTEGGSEVTVFDSHSSEALPAPAKTTPQQSSSVAAGRKPDKRFVLVAVVVLVVVAAGAGLYVLRNKSKIPAKEAASTTTVTAPGSTNPQAGASLAPPAPSDASAPKETVGVVGPASPSAKPAKTEKMKPVVKTEMPQPKKTVPATAPEPAATDFDPKSLDPKENAKLKIDAERLPAGLDFAVEMNGKIYFRRSAEGNKAQYENLFVPPGVQEFRVTARNGAVRKVSNTVSAEFKAKKRKTLKVELRLEGKAADAGVPQGLYPDSQIVVTLK